MSGEKVRTDVLKATPGDAGAEAFIRYVLPILKATKGQPEAAVAQFYAGLIGAALGAMAADFGHARAVGLGQHMLDAFERNAAHLGGGEVSKH